MERGLFDLDKLIQFRKEVHENPELSFQEVETSRKIIKYLNSLGISDERIKRIAKTGIIVDIHGEAPPVYPSGCKHLIIGNNSFDRLENLIKLPSEQTWTAYQ